MEVVETKLVELATLIKFSLNFSLAVVAKLATVSRTKVGIGYRHLSKGGQQVQCGPMVGEFAQTGICTQHVADLSAGMVDCSAGWQTNAACRSHLPTRALRSDRRSVASCSEIGTHLPPPPAARERQVSCLRHQSRVHENHGQLAWARARVERPEGSRKSLPSGDYASGSACSRSCKGVHTRRGQGLDLCDGEVPRTLDENKLITYYVSLCHGCTAGCDSWQ